jgi:glucose-1-phosphate thymidylyltransferase
MKGVLLAGGSGSRLYPLTLGISKQLLPVGDKPMIYYSLSTLMLAGIKEILLISDPDNISGFRRLLGSGKALGVNITYEVQEKPEGLAQALMIAESFLNGDSVCLMLGDNLLYGAGLTKLLRDSVELLKGATVFGYRVPDPARFGVAEFDASFNVLSIEEKPSIPKSDVAVIGLYFFDGRASSFSKTLKRSARGEFEITDLNNIYIAEESLTISILGRGYSWFDTGTHESLAEASIFINSIERHTGYKIGCVEEIAYKNGWISSREVSDKVALFSKTAYGEYLKSVVLSASSI